MTKHGKIYYDYFHVHPGQRILCEVCGETATEIHHIIFRSQGGGNNIENLIALCRGCHDQAHDKQEPFLPADFLTACHMKFTQDFSWLTDHGIL